MFVAYYCEGCSAAPITQYKNNKIEQELTKEKSYFGDNSDERLYIDMRRNKGYTNELEKLTRDDGGATLTTKIKQAVAKKWGWGLLPFLRMNIGILVHITAV